MIFDLTRNYVPEAYRDSRDYRVFLRMLSMLVSVNKDNIDSFINLYNAESCPAELLPLLGNTLGYKYDEGLSIENNRIIIKYYPILLRYRGSETGLKLAVTLSVNTSGVSDSLKSVSNLVIQFSREEGVIKIYYDHPELINWNLIEVVRPLGMRVEFIKSGLTSSTEELQLKAHVRAHINPYNEDDMKVDKSKVGFGDNFTEIKRTIGGETNG